MKKDLNRMIEIAQDTKGRVLPPLVLWALGVPGGICLVLWLIFFRG